MNKKIYTRQVAGPINRGVFGPKLFNLDTTAEVDRNWEDMKKSREKFGSYQRGTDGGGLRYSQGCRRREDIRDPVIGNKRMEENMWVNTDNIGA